MKWMILGGLAGVAFSMTGQLKTPTFEEVIALQSPGQIELSTDGRNLAFTSQSTDWEENRFDIEIWLSQNGQEPFQLTNTPKNSSTHPRFSPDGKWMAFLADRGQKNQIHVIRIAGGEALAVTHEVEGVNSFEWHPDGQSFVFLKNEKEDLRNKEREKRYGAYETDDQDYRLAHLWQLSFDPNNWSRSKLPCYETVDSLKRLTGCYEVPKPLRLTSGPFTVTSFKIAPDGQKIAFTHQPDPLINSSLRSEISLYYFGSKTSELLIQNPGPDGFSCWSPSSVEFIYTSSLDDTTSYYYKNSKAFIYHLNTKVSRRIAQSMDEDLGDFYWHQRGIYTVVWQKTKRQAFKVLEGPAPLQHLEGLPDVTMALAFSRDGMNMSVLGRHHDQLNEIFVKQLNGPVKQLTNFTDQIKAWQTGSSEVISWKSQDGTTIEGILHKPVDYQTGKKYPLLVVIHGGPTGIDLPQPVPAYVYPITQWLAKGCLVLRPNYRGSAGYGEAFRSLNVRNLGIGDAWDVLSGVNHLQTRGMIDTSRLGAMGWSQGGYISAFLTTTSSRFRAISVGAGISDWMTYYVNTDIHPFTRQYLKSTPWEDPAIYQKTSPMHYINQAKTPTLIQHGEYDRRVPIPNAYQLLQGLRDRNVPAELIVYKGFGHGITKPKERLAAVWHNWQWFNRYIWGEEVKIPGL